MSGVRLICPDCGHNAATFVVPAGKKVTLKLNSTLGCLACGSQAEPRAVPTLEIAK